MASGVAPEPDIPESLSVLASEARPTRVVIIDAGQPVPDLVADERYSDAWILFRDEHGAPRGVLELDLLVGKDEIHHNVTEFMAGLAVKPIHSRPPFRDGDAPLVSVVIPSAVRRLDDLQDCLESLEQLDHPSFEIVLVDNRPTQPADDLLRRLVADHGRVRLVHEPRPGVSAARNAGVAVARGELIAFTDDDVRVEPSWLRALCEPMVVNSQVGAVTGLVVPTELETPAQVWFERYFGGLGTERTFDSVVLTANSSAGILRGSRISVRDIDGREVRRSSVYGVGAFAAGANMAFRRSALERVGGFDCTLGTGTPARGGEDLGPLISILWTGGSIAYEPSAMVHHRHRRGYRELLTQIDGYCTGFTALLVSLVRRDHRHAVGIAALLPAAIVAQIKQSLRRARGVQVTSHSVAGNTRRYPASLFRHEMWGFVMGPFAYVRSQKWWRDVTDR